MRRLGLLLFAVWISGTVSAAGPANCGKFDLDGKASSPLQIVDLPPTGNWVPQMRNGFPIPDPACTPGAINPTLTAEVLRDPDFT